MKKQVTFILALVILPFTLMAQSPTPEEARAMAERIQHMSPDQMMKFRDSLTNALTKNAATAHPNTQQMLAKHHYDTSYVKVHFTYTYQRTTASKYVNGTTNASFTGDIERAPMLYEANGHKLIKAQMGMGTNDFVNNRMNSSAKALNRSTPYMEPGDAQSHTDLARQQSFAAMSGANVNMNVAGNYSFEGNSPQGTTSKHGQKTLAAYVIFDYDPLENIASAGAGGEMAITNEKTGEEENTGVGARGTTDPTKAKIAGGGSLGAEPGAGTMNVEKTPTGFKVTYRYDFDHNEDGGSEQIHEVLTMIIGDKPAGYIAKIVPLKKNVYEHWLPKGPPTDNTNDAKGDDSLKFRVVVCDAKDENKIYPGTYSVHWKLLEATRYPGFCSNYPAIRDAKKDADLVFCDSMKHDPNFMAKKVNDSDAVSNETSGVTAYAQIHCNDYAAWAKLQAEVTLDDGTSLQAEPYYDHTFNYITIPYDMNENKIADAWETLKHINGKNYPPDWDEDPQSPNNGNNGDNISLLDEYRGFVVDSNGKSAYVRLDPLKKELFVLSTQYSADQHPDLITAGAKLYSKASQVTTYTIGTTLATFPLMAANNQHKSAYLSWVNYNSPLKHHTYGIPVYISPYLPNHTSEANTKCLDGIPVGNGAQTPEDDDYITVFWNEIIDSVIRPKAAWFLPYSQDLDSYSKIHLRHAYYNFGMPIDTAHLGDIIKTKAELITERYCIFTIAHELGHATNICHHHLDEMDVDKNGKPRNIGYYRGVKSCPMRYWVFTPQLENTPTTCPYNWDRIVALLSTLWDPTKGLWPDGSKMEFCTTDDNCMHKLKLKK